MSIERVDIIHALEQGRDQAVLCDGRVVRVIGVGMIGVLIKYTDGSVAETTLNNIKEIA